MNNMLNVTEATIRIESLEVEGPDIFYREAGRSGHPKPALFHGFPVSAHQDRHLIPALGGKFHVLAVKHIANNVIRFHDELRGRAVARTGQDERSVWRYR